MLEQFMKLNHSSNTTALLDSTPAEESSTSVEDIVVGCALSIGGNLLISISLNVQRFAHLKIEKEEDESKKNYMKSPIWWLGLILMGIGEGGNFLAYAFAPASLVAPLGATTVVANMFIAVIFLKEKLRVEDIIGCVFAAIGAFLIVMFSQKDEIGLNADELVGFLKQTSFIVYISIETMILTGLLVLYHKFKYKNVLVILLITSIIASFTVISTKAVSSMIFLTFAGNMQMDTAVFWCMLLVMAVTLVAQVRYLNKAMKAFYSTIVVPINFVFFTISAIIAGIVFYREFWGMTALQMVMFLVGTAMCFIGVYFITAGRAEVPGPADNGPTLEINRVRSRTEEILRDIIPAWMLSSVTEEKNIHPQADVDLPDDEPILDAFNVDSCDENMQLDGMIYDDIVNNKPSYGAVSNLTDDKKDPCEKTPEN